MIIAPAIAPATTLATIPSLTQWHCLDLGIRVLKRKEGDQCEKGKRGKPRGKEKERDRGENEKKALSPCCQHDMAMSHDMAFHVAP